MTKALFKVGDTIKINSNYGFTPYFNGETARIVGRKEQQFYENCWYLDKDFIGRGHDKLWDASFFTLVKKKEPLTYRQAMELLDENT